jgi:hypothetical protein
LRAKPTQRPRARWPFCSTIGGMLSSGSRYRFVLLVGLASCRQACGLPLADGASGGAGANAGGGGANVDGGGGAGAGASNTSTSSSNGGEGGMSTSLCNDSNPWCTELDNQESLLLAGCEGEAGAGGGDPSGGQCVFSGGQLRITPDANTGFWDGGESTFVHFQGGQQSDSFLAHTVVDVENLGNPFTLAGLVVRDSGCPVTQGMEADCNTWFKAEVGGFSAVNGYPNTLDAANGLRWALHNGSTDSPPPDNFEEPPGDGNVSDAILPEPGPYQVAICALKEGPNFQVAGVARASGGSWQSITLRDLLLVPSLEVGLVAATSSVSNPPFTASFDYFVIQPIASDITDPEDRCDAAFNSIPPLP